MSSGAGAGAQIEVSVDAGLFPDAPLPLLEDAVRTVLAEAGVRMGEVSVAVVSDPEIRDLNRAYLGKDWPTDVIAFSLGGAGSLLGDIYVGGEQGVRQAEELGISRDEEWVRLVVHGTLHLLGHDHPEGAERTSSEMFRLQERLVAAVLARMGRR